MTRSRLPKLIATDLDGTIVRSDDTVSGFTRQVLDRTRAAGIHLAAATGRGPRLLDLTRHDVPAAEYLVLAGGGQVVTLTDPETPVVLRDVRLDGPAVAALLADLEAAVGCLTVMVEALPGPEAPLWGQLIPAWPWPERVEPMPRAQALAADVVKVFVRANGLDTDRLISIATELFPPDKASVTQSGLGYAEICPPEVDKASGLAVVARELGVDPSDVLVFGDMPNDVPMFTWAGWGRVAVANAHPTVRTLADEITLSNDEDGVAVWLNQLLAF